MTTSIAKEAFVEAKELRKVAEQNAKRALLEQVTPTIKQMIEKQLLGENMYEVNDEDILIDADPSDSHDIPPAAMGLEPEMPVGNAQQVDVAAGEPAGITLPGEDGKVTLDVDSLCADDDVMLTAESIQALAKLTGAQSERFGVQTLRVSKKLAALKEQKSYNDVAYSEKLKQLKVEIESMYRDLQEAKMPKETKSLIDESLEGLFLEVNKRYIPVKLRVIKGLCNNVVRKAKAMNEVAKTHNLTPKAKELFGAECVKTLKEAVAIHASLNELNSVANNKTIDLFSGKVARLCKEIFDMANKRGKLNEGALRLILRDLPDGVDVGSLSVDVEPAPEGMDDDMDSMGDEDMGGDLDLGAGDEGGEPGAELEMPDLEEMDMAIDVDLPDDVEVDTDSVSASAMSLDDDMEDDAMDDVGDLDGEEGSEDSMDMEDDDEVVEISEAMLRKELQRLRARRLNESPMSDVSSSPREYDGTAHGPKGQEDQFGGGTGTGEPFVDWDDSDLNTLGESLEEADDDDDDLDESDLHTESVRTNKALTEKLNSYKQAASKYQKKLVQAQKQIAEANLFNAKLVYANKLLSNENLSQKQRTTIVNALNGAESIKEVKKLYAHLNEALGNNKAKGKLTENKAVRTVLGGGSRVQRTGGTSQGGLNEAEEKEFGRWGELAGILRD